MFRHTNLSCTYFLGFGQKLLFLRVKKKVDGFIKSKAEKVTDITRTANRKHVGRTSAVGDGSVNGVIVAKDIQNERK